jgi:hypothetical protein
MGSDAGGVKVSNSLDLCDLGVSAVETHGIPSPEVPLLQTAHHQKETLTVLARERFSC